MLRFILGLLIVYGFVGGLENDSATLGEFFLGVSVGFALMVWALPTLARMEK